MSMKKIRFWMSLALAACLLFGMVPFGVFAASQEVSITGINAYNFRGNDWYIILNTDNASFSLSAASSLTTAGVTIDGAAAGGWFQAGTGTLAFTLATDKANHKVVLPAGMVLNGFTLKEDYVFFTQADGSVKAGVKATGFNAYNFRGNDWYIILDTNQPALSLSAVSSLSAAGVTVDGTVTGGWFQATSGNAGKVAFTLATDKAEHTVVIPQGTVLGNYILAEDYVFYTHADGSLSAKSAEPEVTEPETEPVDYGFSITGIQAYNYRVNNNDWYIILNVDNAAFNMANVVSLATSGITVDGAATTGWIQKTTGTLEFTLGTDKADHEIIIPAGMKLGEYVLENDYVFYTHADGAVNTVAPVKKVNITGIQAYNFRVNNNDWYIVLNVDNAAFNMANVASLATSGITVDGEATTGWIQKTTGTLEFSLGTDKADHEVIIPAGMKLGEYVLENDYVFYTHADGAVNTVAPVKKVNITGIKAYNFRNANADWYIVLETDNASFSLSDVISLTTAGVTVDGVAASGWIQKTSGTLEFSLKTDEADHEIILPAGMKLGEYVLENAYVFYTHSSGAVDTVRPMGYEGWSMTLGDDLDMNFYVSIAETDIANTRVQISIGDETFLLSPENLDEETGYYKFTAELAAAQMTETVTFTLLLGDSVKETKTYTVRQYADIILEGNYDEATKNLVRSMLHYGAAAQVYFDHLPKQLANAQLPAPINTPIPEQAETEKSVQGSVTGISYFGSSLVHRSKTAVRFYFEAAEVEGCTFTANGKPYLPEKKIDGLYYVEIDGINPQELSESITLTVEKGGETLTVVYGPMNYIVRMGVSGTAELKELLLAMYNYHLSAVNFFVKSL